MREELKVLHTEIGKVCRDAYGVIDIHAISLYLGYIKPDLSPADRYAMYGHLVYDAGADKGYGSNDEIPKNLASNNQPL